MPKNFLFLQSVCSPFFNSLAKTLLASGHGVHKIHFNGGDVLYWNNGYTHLYRKNLEALPSYVDQMCQQHNITDIVLFGDCRPVHRLAIEGIKHLGLQIHVFEEGYFRPHWITLERGGVNAYSRLPKKADWYLHAEEKIKGLPLSTTQPFVSKFAIRATHDVLYHIASAINPIVFPGYKTHASVSAPIVYLAYIRKFINQKRIADIDQGCINRLVEAKTDFYLLPLQLNSDAQIRAHSSFTDMVDVMAYVFASFAKYAPTNTKLVIKNHPLDMGLINYVKAIHSLVARYQLEDRIIFLQSGDLEKLVQHAKGVVTVNSTVGLVSLGAQCPTITLSNPIYNLEGLTYQGTLDEFWLRLPKPNRDLFTAFKNVVTYATQINGGFYCAQGIDLAVRNTVPRLLSERSYLEELL